MLFSMKWLRKREYVIPGLLEVAFAVLLRVDQELTQVSDPLH